MEAWIKPTSLYLDGGFAALFARGSGTNAAICHLGRSARGLFCCGCHQREYCRPDHFRKCGPDFARLWLKLPSSQ